MVGWQGKAIALRRGEDFDQVVLGISLGLLPTICKELIASSQAWSDMIANVQLRVGGHQLELPLRGALRLVHVDQPPQLFGRFG